MTDTLIFQGGEVKSLGGGRVGGYLVRFSTPADPDLVGDFFTSETDFDLYEGKTVPMLFNHGLDPVLKRRRLGRASLKLDDVGVWAEGILSERDEYEKKILELVEAGKLGWSSGSAPHMVEREQKGTAAFVKSWPIVEASQTHTPCEPRTRVESLKSFALREGADIPGGAQAAPSYAEKLDRLLADLKGAVEQGGAILALRQAEPKPRTLGAERRAQLEAVKSELDSLLKAAAPLPPPDVRSVVVRLHEIKARLRVAQTL